MRLVFIHGRAQEGRDPALLREEWISALTDGLNKSGLRLPIDPSQITLPFFGDILFKLTRGAEDLDPNIIARGPPGGNDLVEFQAEALEEIVSRAGIEVSPDGVITRGPENWNWVLRIVRAIDNWLPGASGQAIRLILRDVYLYCNRRGITDAVDEIVQAEINQEPTVVVSHSLGTVVAYNILRNDPRALQVRKLVTVGSPLSIRAIRSCLTPLKSPKVVAWFNAFDPRDIVALNPLDANNFSVTLPISNKNDVDNFTENRHGIAGYLSDDNVAREIYNALTE